MTKKTAKVKYLIIGNSAGGVGAAEAIREIDKPGSLAIVSDEPYPAYSRPLIAEYLAKKCSFGNMLFRPADFYQRNDISTLLGSKVKRVRIEGHTIELEDGRRITWQKLLLATGGLPIIPTIGGINRDGVFTFTTLDDAKKIVQFLSLFLIQATRKAVVVGGGLIGVSVTEALAKRGVKVTMVEMKERVLNTILDEEASALEEEALRKVGVEIITGCTVAEVNSYSGGAVTSVTLNVRNGRPVSCNLVVVAIGVRPRTELASEAGIKVNRGMVVDRHMGTSSPDVYACGDAAEAYDFAYCENRLTPIWPNAYLGGRIAGLNMAGVSAEYKGGTAMNSLKYFGLAVTSAGIVNPPDESYEVVKERYDHSYKKIVLKDGFIVGMVFAGDIERSGVVFNLMKDRVEAESFKRLLVAQDFSLACLPEEWWRPRLEMPSSGLALPAKLTEPSEAMVAGE